ncbi:MAG: acyl-CoA dehydrogenase, partial [Pseudomonadota bacterium]
MGFTQQPPLLANQYLEDRLLRSLLRRVMPPPVLAAIEPSLTDLGDRVADWYPAQVAAHAEQ